MLPGIRFVLATMLLTVSLAICGLGATALLKAAQQNSADLPVLQALRDPFPPVLTATPPTLALLRVEPPATDAAAIEADPSTNDAAVVATTSPPGEAVTPSVAGETAISAADAKNANDAPAQTTPALSASADRAAETPVAVEQSAPPSAEAPDVASAIPDSKIVVADDPTTVQQNQTSSSSTAATDTQPAATAGSENAAVGNIVTGSIDPATAAKATPSAGPAMAKRARVVRRVRRVARATPRQQTAAKQTQASPFGF